MTEERLLPLRRDHRGVAFKAADALYKRCMYYSCCRILFLATFLSVAHGQRGSDGYVSYQCLDSPWPSHHKPPVIMLHGTADTKATWNGIYQKIPLLTGRKVCIFDLRNNGDSSWSNEFSVEAFAKDLGSFMDSLHIKKAALVGHDVGGLAVIRFALKNPHRVESVFVEDMSPKGVGDDVAGPYQDFFRIMLQIIATVSPHEDKGTIVQTVKDNYIRITGQSLPDYLFNSFPFRCDHCRWQWKTNIRCVIKAIDDLPKLLGKNEGVFHGPVCIMHGSKSQFNLAEDEDFIKKVFPKAQIYVVEGADHYIHQNCPELFTKKLIQFLNRRGCQKCTVKPCCGCDKCTVKPCCGCDKCTVKPCCGCDECSS